MLRFLSSLFSGPAEQAGQPDEGLLEKAIERVVAGTDPRIRALGQYRARLHDAVAGSVMHVITLVDGLPPPITVSARRFGDDAKLRAFFASPEHLSEVLGKFRTVREFLQVQHQQVPEAVFGLLTMCREDRDVFGMELDGDVIRRDVMQVAVNFSSHRYVCPNGDEPALRRDLKKRAFDFLVERALERIMAARSQRSDMDRQRHLLRRKLDAMKAGNWGLASALMERDAEPSDQEPLEAEIAAIDAEFGQFRSDSLGLEEALGCILEVFSCPANWLARRETTLRTDLRGIMIPESSAASANELSLTELFSGTGETRVVTLGRIDAGDVPDQPDFWQGAKRYL